MLIVELISGEHGAYIGDGTAAERETESRPAAFSLF